MTLKDKFYKVFIYSPDIHPLNESEQIADDYAIEFAEWIDNIRTLDNGVYALNSYEKLLEIFKKEKGL